MASKPLYVVVAVVGIAAASGAAWWYQNKASRPAADMGKTVSPAGGASSGAGSGGAPAGGWARSISATASVCGVAS